MDVSAAMVRCVREGLGQWVCALFMSLIFVAIETGRRKKLTFKFNHFYSCITTLSYTAIARVVYSFFLLRLQRSDM